MRVEYNMGAAEFGFAFRELDYATAFIQFVPTGRPKGWGIGYSSIAFPPTNGKSHYVMLIPQNVDR